MQFLIKLDNGVPTGSPLLLSNVQQADPAVKAINKSFILSADISSLGYGVFLHTTPAENTDQTKEYKEMSPTVQNADGQWLQSFVLVDKVFATPEDRKIAVIATNTSLLNKKLSTLKSNFEAATKRPSVNTTLGFNVDGGREDLENFQIGKDLGLLKVVDVDGVSHDIVLDDYDVIINAIKTTGLAFMQSKWDLKAELNGIDLTVETSINAINSVDISTPFPSTSLIVFK